MSLSQRGIFDAGGGVMRHCSQVEGGMVTLDIAEGVCNPPAQALGTRQLVTGRL